ncbi:hypothetical protein F4782DRAFT_463662 [Xylaria castorea]|nr:hypothetical protein F4782DRAFT_463662 [Xylaria castorea]
MAALWFDHIDGKILMGLDTVVSFLYLAGGVVSLSLACCFSKFDTNATCVYLYIVVLLMRIQSLTVALQSASSCTATDEESQYDRYYNKILNGGCIHTEQGPLCHSFNSDGKDLTPGRCQTAKADYVFEYVGFIFGIVMVCLGYALNRRGRGGTIAINML